MEVTVCNNVFAYTCNSIGGLLLSVNREIVDVEHMESAVHKFVAHFDEFFNRACCHCFSAEVGELNRTVFESTRPVGIHFFTVYGLSDDVFVVRCPVDSGRDDKRFGASVDG